MGKVVHFEIPFDDKARATKFYADALDWQLADMPEMDYVMASTVEIDEQYRPKESGAINGGLVKRPTEAPAPVVYVLVESIPDAIAKVEKAGGRVVTPFTPIPGMGSFARVTDTEGNVIGLYQEGQ